MEITADQCEFKEEYEPGERYSCYLFYNGQRVAFASIGTTARRRMDGKIIPGWYFTEFKVPEDYRGNRLSSFLLDKVIEFAKEHNICIVTQIAPTPEGGLDLEQLTEFFIRHGFRKLECGLVYFEP